MKLWKRIAALCLALSLCLSLASCWKKAPEETTAAATTAGAEETGNYTIQVTAESGTPFEGIGIYVYEDATQSELVWFAKTDAEGRISFTDNVKEGYVAVLDKVPQGYVVAEQYPLTGLETSIVLAVEMADEVDLTTASFRLGDVMYDLKVTDVNGQTWQLSKLLEEKKAVVLNFWYLTCTPCRMEFPHLQKAYEKYAGQVAVLALNTVDSDEAAIGAYAKEMGLTFPVAAADPNLAKAMGLVSYPTTIVIDQSGIISLSHVGSLDSADDFEDIFAHFTAEDYKGGVVKDLEDILTDDKDEDEEVINNPTEVGGVTSFQLTVRAGETVYCDVYRLDGMYMTIKSENAELLYGGKNYKPKNGTIGVTIHCKDTRTPAVIGLRNNGEETETFTINFSAPQGTLNNPFPLKLGKFDVSIPAGEEEGVYYSYKAAKDGYFTVRCISATKGVPYDYTLYNLDTYANRNLAADAVKDEDGHTVVQVKVSKGDDIQFSASALPDDSGTYPAIKMKFEASITDAVDGTGQEDVEKTAYAVTVTDENRKGISGVQVYLVEQDPEEEAKPTTANLKTDDKGVAASNLPVGSYKVTLKVPVGYTAYTTEFLLTEEASMLSVKFDTLNTETKTYTVKVVDETGKGISGATVVIGGQSLTTNSKGIVTVDLPEYTYTVEVGLPSGAVLSGAFEAGKTTLTITAESGGSGEEKPGETYTVKVVDYGGNAMKDVTVTFQRSGSTVGMVKTNASGEASMKLAKGTYTVSLAFASGAYHYEETVLTEDTTSATVTVYAKRGSEYTELYVGYAYHLNVGATYVDGMQANVPNYFIFRPTQSGVYRFTTNDPAAVISYWGANDAYIANQTNVTDYADNAYTREFREDQVGNSMVIIGVTGATECVVEIIRTGDVQLTDEEKAEWIIFEGTQTPKEGTTYKVKESGTQTYVDIKGQTADYEIVKGSDGFYHLGSANGPLMYVNLGPGGKYISFYQMMGFEQAGGTNMHQIFYDENGKFIKKEDYTTCLKAYAGAVDAEGYGLYPLTDDLIYILKNGGENKQWWVETSPNYLFSGTVNPEIAWMFNCCYFA